MPNKLSPKKERISAALEKKLVADARILAQKYGVALSDIIRDAITQYVAETKRVKKDENDK
mgnify:CR=1 FL=1